MWARPTVTPLFRWDLITFWHSNSHSHYSWPACSGYHPQGLCTTVGPGYRKDPQHDDPSHPGPSRSSQDKQLSFLGGRTCVFSLNSSRLRSLGSELISVEHQQVAVTTGPQREVLTAEQVPGILVGTSRLLIVPVCLELLPSAHGSENKSNNGNKSSAKWELISVWYYIPMYSISFSAQSYRV